MTIAQIVAKIKTLAHDNSLTDTQIYDFLDMVVTDMELDREFNYQYIKDESVTVSAGTVDVNTTYDVKRIVSVDGYDMEDLNYVEGQLQIAEADTSDLTLSITYIRSHPQFDGSAANHLVEDDWVLISGGVMYAMMFDTAPEMEFWQMEYNKRLNAYYLRDQRKLDITDDDWRGTATDAVGV